MALSEEVSRQLERVVAKVGDLPAMPEVVAEVVGIIESPDVSISDVSRVIERDPGLSAKLLEVSNSPYYGMRQVVGTLKLALVVLGVKEVQNIVLGITVLDTMGDGDIERRMQDEGIWTDSVLAAGVAKRLGAYFELSFQGEDFIAALLHDIGKIVLWKQFTDAYEEICEVADGDKAALPSIEFENLGFDHADVAAALAYSWNLPPSLTDALRYSIPREDKKIADAADQRLAALVRIAALIAREDWEAGPPAEPPESATDQEAWAILLANADPIDIPERTNILQSIVSELEAAPALNI